MTQSTIGPVRDTPPQKKKPETYRIITLEVLDPLLTLALLTTDVDDVEHVTVKVELDLLSTDGKPASLQNILVAGLVSGGGDAIDGIKITG